MSQKGETYDEFLFAHGLLLYPNLLTIAQENNIKYLKEIVNFKCSFKL